MSPEPVSNFGHLFSPADDLNETLWDRCPSNPKKAIGTILGYSLAHPDVGI